MRRRDLNKCISYFYYYVSLTLFIPASFTDMQSESIDHVATCEEASCASTCSDPTVAGICLCAIIPPTDLYVILLYFWDNKTNKKKKKKEKRKKRKKMMKRDVEYLCMHASTNAAPALAVGFTSLLGFLIWIANINSIPSSPSSLWLSPLLSFPILPSDNYQFSDVSNEISSESIPLSIAKISEGLTCCSSQRSTNIRFPNEL